MIEHNITANVRSPEHLGDIKNDLKMLDEFLIDVIDSVRIIKHILIDHSDFGVIVYFYIDTEKLAGASTNLGKIKEYIEYIAIRREFETDRLRAELKRTIKETISKDLRSHRQQ